MKRFNRPSIALIVAGAVFVIGGLAAWVSGAAAVEESLASDPEGAGPFGCAQRTITTTNPVTGNSIQTILYYPANGSEIDPSGAPYAAIVFAHGFMATPSSYPGDGQHLASWGYIVAMPDFPNEDTTIRASDALHILSYLESENANPSSPLFGKVNLSRIGVAGHSLGGLTTLMAAARDARVRAAVALDPVNPPDFMAAGWDYEAEAPQISAPILIVGAPGQYCNSFANYNDMYPCIGSEHKAKVVLSNGSHCDFMMADNQAFYTACYWLCGGSYDQARVRLPLGYMTAWFNYYLRDQTDYYTYLFGAEAQADVQAGRVVNSAQTAPRNVAAVGVLGGIHLTWETSAYTVVTGYNIYRSTTSGSYSDTPYAQVGKQGYFQDAATVHGSRYYYTIRSRDAAGNEHESSAEVSAIAGQLPTPTGTSAPTSTRTPTITLTPAATPTQTVVSPTIEVEKRIHLPIVIAE